MRTFIVVLCLISISSRALALDGGVGSFVTCSMWLQSNDKLKSWFLGENKAPMPTEPQVWSNWLLGFLEGVKWACLANPPLASGLDAGAVFERVDRICRSKPDYALLQVAHDLVQELDPQHRNLVRVCDPFAPVR